MRVGTYRRPSTRLARSHSALRRNFIRRALCVGVSVVVLPWAGCSRSTEDNFPPSPALSEGARSPARRPLGRQRFVSTRGCTIGSRALTIGDKRYVGWHSCLAVTDVATGKVVRRI